MANVSAVDNELDALNVVIAAAEDWSKQYSRDSHTHAKLIKLEAKIERTGRKYFRELAKDRISNYVNWHSYRNQAVQAFDINVIFNTDDFSTNENGILVKLLHDPLLDGVGLGLSAGQTIYNRPLGLSTYDAAVQKAALEYSSTLVTKINEITRDRIRQSIQTSLGLGENVDDAASRIEDIVNDPMRAATIARTEAVNSYSKGIMSFGKASGAIGKVWHDVGAEDVCADNADEGQIDIDDTFGSGDDAPAAHPNCRCGLQLIYDTGSSDE